MPPRNVRVSGRNDVRRRRAEAAEINTNRKQRHMPAKMKARRHIEMSAGRNGIGGLSRIAIRNS